MVLCNIDSRRSSSSSKTQVVVLRDTWSPAGWIVINDRDSSFSEINAYSFFFLSTPYQLSICACLFPSAATPLGRLRLLEWEKQLNGHFKSIFEKSFSAAHCVNDVCLLSLIFEYLNFGRKRRIYIFLWNHFSILYSNANELNHR